jgi:hypothetical protein
MYYTQVSSRTLSPVSDVAGVACSLICLTGPSQQHKQRELAAMLLKHSLAQQQQQQSDSTDDSIDSSKYVSIAGSTVLARCYASCHVDVILVVGGVRPQWQLDPSYHIVHADSKHKRKQQHHSSSSSAADISYDAPVIECFDILCEDDSNAEENYEESATEQAQRALVRQEIQQGGLMPHMVSQT